MTRRAGAPGAWTAAGIYLVLAVIVTWPLATEMTRVIAGDLGDPVLNCWILLWTSGQMLAALHGHPAALQNYWNGNIFYPERLTLAYSEHLTPQAIQILPIVAATGNILLSYNLLFLSTIVLAGVGAFLLVRELTGRPGAALVAGLAFAFTPYRIAQVPHVQVLSTYWMPLALYGLRRFFVSGRLRPLAGGAAALVLQNLSCGYYMLYFTPFAAAYCVYEVSVRRLWRSRRTWIALGGAAAGVIVLSWPFIAPYLHLRQISDLGVRSVDELMQYSADVLAYATASDYLRLWGNTVQAFPAPEGAGFQGFTIMALALVGTGAAALAAIRAARPTPPLTPLRQFAVGALVVALLVSAAGCASVFLTGGFHMPFARTLVVLNNGETLLGWLAVAILGLLIAVPAIRRAAGALAWSEPGFFAAAALVAAFLSLGPYMRASGRPIGTGPYLLLYRFVPGFDGLRVPARYFLVVALFLSVLAGYGMARVLARWRRAGVVVAAAAALLIVAESWAAPFPVDRPFVGAEYRDTGPLPVGRQMSPLYHMVERLPAGTVLVEFPFGDPGYDMRAMFYAGYHRKPILNGHSGFTPTSYGAHMDLLSGVPADPAAAWQDLMASGVTHAIVHEGAYRDDHGREVSDLLRRFGAKEIGRSGGDLLFELRPGGTRPRSDRPR